MGTKSGVFAIIVGVLVACFLYLSVKEMPVLPMIMGVYIACKIHRSHETRLGIIIPVISDLIISINLLVGGLLDISAVWISLLVSFPLDILSGFLMGKFCMKNRLRNIKNNEK